MYLHISCSSLWDHPAKEKKERVSFGGRGSELLERQLTYPTLLEMPEEEAVSGG